MLKVNYVAKYVVDFGKFCLERKKLPLTFSLIVTVPALSRHFVWRIFITAQLKLYVPSSVKKHAFLVQTLQCTEFCVWIAYKTP
jgi:hypothetical protein